MRAALHFLSVFFVLGAIGFSQDTGVAAKEAWLGLSVSKPDDVTTNQLPALPPGIGFVVSEIAAGGPADKAGVRRHDVLWKMEQQMLVNEGQLATLLRLASPGDDVTVSVFREGQSLDLKVTLGEDKKVWRVLVDTVIRPDDGPIRIVNLQEKRAVVTNERGIAELTRRDDGDIVRIMDKEGKVVFQAKLGQLPELSSVPEGWSKQVCAMRRGLDHALSATPAPMRQPRPRVIPPPTEAPLTLDK